MQNIDVVNNLSLRKILDSYSADIHKNVTFYKEISAGAMFWMSVSKDLPCKHVWILFKYKEENKRLGNVFLKNVVPPTIPVA